LTKLNENFGTKIRSNYDSGGVTAVNSKPNPYLQLAEGEDDLPPTQISPQTNVPKDFISNLSNRTSYNPAEEKKKVVTIPELGKEEEKRKIKTKKIVSIKYENAQDLQKLTLDLQSDQS